MGKIKWALGVVGLVLAACGSGSGGSSSPPPSNNPVAPNGVTITIHNMAFSPLDLTVDAGTVISIVNEDSMQHTVTSESKDNDFTAGSVAGVSFDSGFVQPGGNPAPSNPPPSTPYPVRGTADSTGASITIPSTAPSGTTIPFFCRNHRGQMATPNGHITVR